MEHDKRHSYGHLGVGLFLLIAGVALMLDKFDIISDVQVWHYWPIIIIAIGLGKLLDAQLAWEYRKACSTLFIGAWFLISELHIFGLDYHNSWPILLIGIGIGMLWKSAYPAHFRFAKDHCHGN
jgi:uncharacterized membrane protein HdeD (DUF308 family)